MHSTLLVKLDYQTALVKLRDMQNSVSCKFMVCYITINEWYFQQDEKLQKVYAVFSIDRAGEGQVGYDILYKGSSVFMYLHALHFLTNFAPTHFYITIIVSYNSM